MAFHQNLVKFRGIVPPNMRARPMYKFLCFILNDRHKNTSILSHFGSKFDILIVREMILAMGYMPLILPQGQGILQMTIPEYQITFLDSYKFFKQKLETLPKMFQLDELKGFFSHIQNLPLENWNILRRHPFPLSSYIFERDSPSVKKEKTKWWTEIKSVQPYFNFNEDCVEYCENDVSVLLKSALKFIVQTFQFGEEMVDRFGISPSYREGLTHLHFHPFQKSTPTLGSFS